jgi:hypothetical protein
VWRRNIIAARLELRAKRSIGAGDLVLAALTNARSVNRLSSARKNFAQCLPVDRHGSCGGNPGMYCRSAWLAAEKPAPAIRLRYGEGRIDLGWSSPLRLAPPLISARRSCHPKQ